MKYGRVDNGASAASVTENRCDAVWLYPIGAIDPVPFCTCHPRPVSSAISDGMISVAPRLVSVARISNRCPGTAAAIVGAAAKAAPGPLGSGTPDG